MLGKSLKCSCLNDFGIKKIIEFLYTSYDFGRVVKLKSLIWAGHIVRIENTRSGKHKNFVFYIQKCNEKGQWEDTKGK